MARIAIVGEGVIGLSTALAVQKRLPQAKITVIHSSDFSDTCSFGPAGLFRIDNVNWQQNREFGRATFDWYSDLCRRLPGSLTGVKLLSGHIMSDDHSSLETQEKANGDIVYNFRWLRDEEIKRQFMNPSKYCIHFSAYAAEGNRYVPFLRSQLGTGVIFEKRTVETLDELGALGFDVVVNCGGLAAGRLAGDDEKNMVPIRGIAIEAVAPWHKQFLYRDFDTFSIPKQDTVVIGSVKERGKDCRNASGEEVEEVLRRYERLQPAMKGAAVKAVWCHLRPSRDGGIRLESQPRTTHEGKKYTVVHHYGHGGSGFTLGWGSALRAAELIEQSLVNRAKL